MIKPLEKRLPHMKFITDFRWENLTPGEIQLIVYLLIKPFADTPHILLRISHEKFQQWIREYFLLDHEQSDYYYRLSDEAKVVIATHLKHLHYINFEASNFY